MVFHASEVLELHVDAIPKLTSINDIDSSQSLTFSLRLNYTFLGFRQ